MLEGKMTNLRPLEIEDLERAYKWINDREVTRYLAARYPLSRKDEKAWLEVIEEESENNAQFRKVYASYSKFREEFKLWGENAYLKR